MIFDHVTAQALDVSFAEDAAAFLSSGVTYDAVFHASGVLRDGLLGNQGLGALRQVFAPKLASAERLQTAFSQAPLTQVRFTTPLVVFA